MATLAERVRELREARQWSTTYVAKFVGCVQSNIVHIEKGRITNPTKQTTRALCSLFGVTETYLKGGDE